MLDIEYLDLSTLSEYPVKRISSLHHAKIPILHLLCPINGRRCRNEPTSAILFVTNTLYLGDGVDRNRREIGVLGVIFLNKLIIIEDVHMAMHMWAIRIRERFLNT